MKILRDPARLLSVNWRDPVVAALAAGAAIVALLILLAIVRVVAHSHFFHRFAHGETQVSAPAGLDAADFSADGAEMSGWAPPGAAIRILEHGKDVAEDEADAAGQWDLSFADDAPHAFRLLNIFWRESGKLAGGIGQLALFAPGPSADDAYVWWQDGEGGDPRLLQTPDAGEDNELFLALVELREGQAPLLEGDAAPGSLVQLYADNRLAGTATADAGGHWILLPVTDGDNKPGALRLDEIDKAAVRERRSYKIAWPDNKTGGDEPAVLQTNNDGWVVGEPDQDGRMLIAILRPDAGTEMPPDQPIPGQVMPVAGGGK